MEVQKFVVLVLAGAQFRNQMTCVMKEPMLECPANSQDGVAVHWFRNGKDSWHWRPLEDACIAALVCLVTAQCSAHWH